MKTFQRNVFFALALFLFFGTNLNAQKKETPTRNGTYIIIQKNNEKETIIKNFDDLDNVLLDFKLEEDTEAFMRGCSPRTPKPFLGIYSDKNKNGKGILISNTVDNSSAQRAGLKAGDIITAIDGTTINSVSDLRTVLQKHKVGDAIDIEYIRGGQATQVEVNLGRKRTRRHYSYRSKTKVKRDPCKVFIGVYSGRSYDQKGVRVNGVVANTPAQEAELLKGDIITAIDGILVHSHIELLKERNKHNPGDEFLISYIRDGVADEVMAKFKSCDQKETSKLEETPIVETPQITQPTNNTLKVEGMEAYPNPTLGDLNLKFKAEALPTTVRIMDVQGRVIYSEDLENFDGNYSRELNVSDGTPGVLTVSIYQNGKVFTKNIILLSRA